MKPVKSSKKSMNSVGPTGPAGPTRPAEENWRERAACRHEDPDLFFPVGSGAPALAQADGARSVCRRCPVREPCLRWALSTGQEYGVWGGTTEAERRSLRRGDERRCMGSTPRDGGPGARG